MDGVLRPHDPDFPLADFPAGGRDPHEPFKFTVLTTAGSAIWNTILISAGYALGANWQAVEGYVGVLTKIVIVIVVVAAAVWAVLRIRKNKSLAAIDHLPEIDARPRTSEAEDVSE